MRNPRLLAVATLLCSISAAYAQLDCENILVIPCTSFFDIDSNGMAGLSNLDSYFCSNGLSDGWSGPEHVYKFTLTSTSQIPVSLSPGGGDTLGLFLFIGSCNSGNEICSELNGGDEHLNETLAPGDHYLVVDSKSGAFGTYSLTVAFPTDDCCIESASTCVLGPDIPLPYGTNQQFADLNHDGYLDLVQFEDNNDDVSPYSIVVYEYVPDTGYSAGYAQTIMNGSLGSSYALADLNNDNKVDLIAIRQVSTQQGVQPSLRGLINQDNFDFGEIVILGPGNITAYHDIPAPGDIDHDGDIDLVACTPESCFALINEGGNNFTQQDLCLYTGQGVELAPAVIADFNKDGVNDLLAERKSGDTCQVVLFDQIIAGCSDCVDPTVIFGEVVQDIGDVDNDGDLDVLVSTKCDGAGAPGLYVLLNQYPADDFAVDSLVSITQCLDTACITWATWKDIDADGDLDIGISYSGTSAIFENQDMTFYQLVVDASYYSPMIFGDYDMDGAMGMAGACLSCEVDQTYYTDFESCALQNLPPVAPTGLGAVTSQSGEVWLSWNPLLDQGLVDSSPSYNLLVSKSNGEIVVSPLADPASGKRRLVAHGAQSQDTFWHLQDLAPGMYTWQVQAIDQACAGGTWSAEDTFSIDTCLYFEQVDLIDTESGTSQLGIADISLDDTQLLDLIFANGSVCMNSGVPEFVCDPSAIDNVGQYLALGDLNNDNLIDVLMRDNSEYIVYTRDASGFDETYSFQGVLSNPFIGDIDNDGDRDILYGNTLDGSVFRIENLGNGEFSAVAEPIFTEGGNVGRNILEVFDIDNDGDLDLLTSKAYNPSEECPRLEVLTNQNGSMQAPTDIGPDYGAIAIGDIDNDGDLDIVSGNIPTDSQPCGPSVPIQVLTNNGGVFESVDVAIDDCVLFPRIALGDLDQDGDLDLVSIRSDPAFDLAVYLTEVTAEGINFSKVYQVDNVANFAIGDIDNDYDIDIVYPAPDNDPCDCYQALINHANSCPNTPPSAPQGVACTASGDSLVISWSPAMDPDQASSSLTYNIVVSEAGDAENLLVSPMAHPGTGFRKVVEFGEQCHNNSWVIHDVEPGNYCVQVQAIDHSYIGGAWSELVCCTVCPASSSEITLGNDSTDVTICRGVDNEVLTFEYVLNYPNPQALYTFLITDSLGNVLTAADSTVDFSGFATGKYFVYGVSYFDALIFTSGTHIDSVTSTICDTLSSNTICVRIDSAYINFLQDTRICAGEAIPIVESTNSTMCVWSPGTGLSDSTACFPIAFPTTTTDYVVVVTSAYGCQSSALVTVIVDPLPAVSLDDVSICPGDSVQLGVAGTAFECFWSPTNGLINPASCSPIASPSTTTTYGVTITDENGCTATDSVTVTLVDSPTAEAGPDTSVCAGECVVLMGTGGVTCTWYEGTDFNSIPISQSCNVEVCPSESTTYSLIVESGDDCADTAQVNVIVHPLPELFVNNDTTICTGDTIQLLAQSTGQVNCQWSPIATLSDPAICDPLSFPTTMTTYTVTVTDQNGCTSSASLSISVEDLPEVTVSGGSVCAGDGIQLAVSSQSSISCQWPSGVSDASSCAPTVSPVVPTTYTVTVTDDATGCTVQADAIVDVYDSPEAAPGVDTSVCIGENIELIGAGGVSCTWYEAQDFPSGPIGSICDILVAPMSTTDYALVVESLEGCMDTAVVTVTVNALPEITAVDGSVCAGQAIPVPVDISGTVNCAWSPGTGLSDANTCQPLAGPLTTTTYIVTVTDNNSCMSTASLTIEVVPSPVADAGSDRLICEGDATLTLSGSGGSTCVWYDVDGTVVAQSCETNVDVIASTSYILEVSEVNAGLTCTDRDTMAVEVAPLPVIVMGADTTICAGDEVALVANISCVDCMCFWEPETGLSNMTECLPIATPPVGTTTYTLRAVDGNGCASTDSIIITVDPVPVAEVINDHFIIHQSRTETFNVIVNDNLTGEWEAELVSGTSDIDVLLFTNGDIEVTTGNAFLGRTTLEYRLMDPVCGHISEIGIVEVVVIENDLVAICDPALESVGCVVLSNIADYPNNRIVVFNRYGNIVHLDSPYENDWDGLNVETGEPVPTGSYYFILELGMDVNGGDGGTIKGVLLVVRQGG